MLDLSQVSNSADIYAALKHVTLPIDVVKQRFIDANILSAEASIQQLAVLRLDTMHDIVSGNKLFKLLPFLQQAELIHAKTLVSFGGRFSNHLHALAYLGYCLGIKTAAFVRGYKEQDLTPMLDDVVAWGMTIYFVGNTEYKQRHCQAYWRDKTDHLAFPYLIPEGGAFFQDDSEEQRNNLLEFKVQSGLQLTQIIQRSVLHSELHSLSVLSVAVGSAGFLDLLVTGFKQYIDVDNTVSLIGVLALKNKDEVVEKLTALGIPKEAVTLLAEHHCGGFAKLNKTLVELICRVYECTGILLDPIYNAKQVLAISDEVNQGRWQGQSVLMIHSGGLQGIRGLYDKMQRIYGKALPFSIDNEKLV